MKDNDATILRLRETREQGESMGVRAPRYHWEGEMEKILCLLCF